MQIIKCEVIFTLRDIENVENFIDQIENNIITSIDTIYNMSSISKIKTNQTNYPDPISPEEINKWTEKSTEIIDQELEHDIKMKKEIVLNVTIELEYESNKDKYTLLRDIKHQIYEAKCASTDGIVKVKSIK